ncbi:MAG: DUF4258 domain-containing protein [Anaerolineae bacterium]
MPEVEFSAHARDMLAERQIPEEWVWRCIESPDQKEFGADNNVHYLKVIEERGGRFLHVVVNPHLRPNRVVTVFFDRRVKRRECEAQD